MVETSNPESLGKVLGSMAPYVYAIMTHCLFSKSPEDQELFHRLLKYLRENGIDPYSTDTIIDGPSGS